MKSKATLPTQPLHPPQPFVYDRKALRVCTFLLLLTAANAARADPLTGFASMVQWVSGLMSLVMILYWYSYARASMGGHHHNSEKTEGMVIGSIIIVAAFGISTMFKMWYGG